MGNHPCRARLRRLCRQGSAQRLSLLGLCRPLLAGLCDDHPCDVCSWHRHPRLRRADAHRHRPDDRPRHPVGLREHGRPSNRSNRRQARRGRHLPGQGRRRLRRLSRQGALVRFSLCRKARRPVCGRARRRRRLHPHQRTQARLRPGRHNQAMVRRSQQIGFGQRRRSEPARHPCLGQGPGRRGGAQRAGHASRTRSRRRRHHLRHQPLAGLYRDDPAPHRQGNLLRRDRRQGRDHDHGDLGRGDRRPRRRAHPVQPAHPDTARHAPHRAGRRRGKLHLVLPALAKAGAKLEHVYADD